MTSHPQVSIIIPAYISSPAQAALLAETLLTAAAQTIQPCEVIVVDDGSPIEVEAIATGPTIRTLKQANGGCAVARNTGIRASRGDYVLFLDADDLLLPPAIEAGLRAFEEHPRQRFRGRAP